VAIVPVLPRGNASGDTPAGRLNQAGEQVGSSGQASTGRFSVTPGAGRWSSGDFALTLERGNDD